MKIWHISDTHCNHKDLIIPTGIDMIIFSGDCSNPRNPYLNENEVIDFLNWYALVEARYKIFIAGNHDSSIEKGLIKKSEFKDRGIIYLENEHIIIEGYKIFGSPFTPSFNDWSFMKSRDKLDKLWKNIDDDTDIIITHGPPKGILDLSENRERKLEFCGDNALRKHILNRIKPLLCSFGHIHNVGDIINAGVLKVANYETIFSNGSCVTDRKIGELSSHGNIIELNK